MRQPEHSNAARIQAANILLDRGWGRAPQARADEDRKDIRGSPSARLARAAARIDVNLG
jgi:hypothetical protein